MSIADIWSNATELKRYRVWMRIRGSIVKPSYDGKCDVWATDPDDAFDRAITECRRTAHSDSPREDFALERVERLSA